MATTKEYLQEVAATVHATNARKQSEGKWPTSAVSIFSDACEAGFKRALEMHGHYKKAGRPEEFESVGNSMESELADELLNRGAI